MSHWQFLLLLDSHQDAGRLGDTPLYCGLLACIDFHLSLGQERQAYPYDHMRFGIAVMLNNVEACRARIQVRC